MPYIDVRFVFREEGERENRLSFYGAAIADTDLSPDDLACQADLLTRDANDLNGLICELLSLEAEQ